MEERTGLVTFKGMPVTLVGKPLQVGQQAPDFTAVKQDLSEFKLSDLEDKYVVLSIAPSLDTKVCELQTIRFNQEVTSLGKDVEVVAVTVDLPFAQHRFCESFSIDQVQVVSDHRDLDFGYKYGLVMKELRLLARAVIILDKEKNVRYVKLNDEIGTEPDYEGALNALRELTT